MAAAKVAAAHGGGSWLRRPGASTGVVLAVVAGLTALGALGAAVAAPLPPWVAHGVSHVVVAAPVAVLAYAAARLWPPARRTAPGGPGRSLIMAGLSGFAAGGFLEVLGARVDEPGAAAWEGAAHTAGQVIAMLSLPVLLLGFGLAVVAAVRDKALPAWTLAIVGLGVVVFGVLVAGVPGSR